MKASNGTFTCTATDGVRLSEYSFNGVDSEFDVVIPTKFAMKVSKAVSLKEEVLVLLDGPIFWVSSGGVLIGGYTVNGVYPDYRKFLKKSDSEILIDKQIFMDNLKNLDFREVEDNKIDLSFNKGILNMSTKQAENDGIPINFDGVFDVSFNIKLLRSVLISIGGEMLKVGFSDKSSVVFFSSASPNKYGEDFVSVLMPMSV